MNNTKDLIKKNNRYNSSDLIQASKKCKDIINFIKNNDDNKILKNRLIKKSNKKLGSNVLIWDLPEIMTCKYACKHCYACKASNLYKNTRIMRLYHLLLVQYAINNKDFLNKLLKYMIIEINQYKKYILKKHNQVIVRFHSAGDFYDSIYKDFILNLVDYYKNDNTIKFYTYSKQLNNNEIDYINKNHNINIVKSLINDKYINFGSIEYIKKVGNIIKKDCKFCVCPYGFNNNKKCMSECKLCLKYSNVMFKQH